MKTDFQFSFTAPRKEKCMLRIYPQRDKLLGFLASREEFVFLDTFQPDGENKQSLLFLDPIDRLVCQHVDSLAKYLGEVQQRLADGYFLAGWINCQFGAMLEDEIHQHYSVQSKKSTCLADLGVFLKPYTFDHATGENDLPLDGLYPLEDAQYLIENIRPNMEQATFVDALQVLRRNIGSGDTSQVNYAMQLLFDFSGSAESMYSALRRNQSVACGSHIRNRGERILSFFPDVFFSKEGAETIVCPGKGDVKPAENCGEKQMHRLELLRTLFSGRSIASAQKNCTVHNCNALVRGSQGQNTRAVGYFSPDGAAVFSVPIRTIRLHGNQGEMEMSAGVRYDTVPEEEWHQYLLKGSLLTNYQPDFYLFETILWRQDSGFYLLEKHLQRMQEGADYFHFSCDMKAVRRRLEEEANAFKHSSFRVRLVLEKDGSIRITAEAVSAPIATSLPLVPGSESEEPQVTIGFSKTRVDATMAWIYFKTSNRQLYTKEYARALKQGLYECIFLNEAGLVTEGCISNIIIYSNGRYRTPPVSCGLLPGVMRGHLLANADVPVVEEVFTAEELRAAEAVYICNSVRGVVRVVLENAVRSVSAN